MTTQVDPVAPRIPLSRERVLAAAVDFADVAGIESVSMRKLGERLGVEAMSLYNHVKNKEDLLDGMVDNVITEIDLPDAAIDWKTSMRTQILAAREAMKRHEWAPKVIETRVNLSASMMRYMDAICGIFVNAGFSLDLTHHALHALGSRMLGFAQELFDDSEALEQSPEIQALMMRQMQDHYPNIHAMTEAITHDDDIEFTFSLDLLLDGIERMKMAEAS